MNDSGSLLFRCRLCQDLATGPKVRSMLRAVREVVHHGVFYDVNSGEKVPLVQIHRCANGGIGQADFVGASATLIGTSGTLVAP